MNVRQRLEYIECGAKKPIVVRAFVENKKYIWIEKFEVFSIKTADEDILEIIKKANDNRCEPMSLVKGV